MKDLAALLTLPASLLALLANTLVAAQEPPWPYNLPRTLKYYPEQETYFRRNAELQQRAAWQTPVGVRKMSVDEGEKFFLHYWDLGPDGTTLQDSNATLPPPPLYPAIAPHTNRNKARLNLLGRNIFARAFQCPANTISCSTIGSDLCCPSGQTCLSIAGGVGCCPIGGSCGNTVASCNTGAGYTSCPNSPNGGCCVPGASCDGAGCVLYGTETVTATLPTSTITAGVSFSTAAGGAGTTIYAIPVPTSIATSVLTSGYTTTLTVTQSISGQVTTVVSPTTVVIATTIAPTTTPSTAATSQGTLTCTAGFQSCPESLGGGCCPNGQVCGTSGLCPNPPGATTTTTTSAGGAAGAPIRPTSVTSVTSPMVSAASAPSSSAEACPTGFYMCSAYYLGGCCRVGRNCDTTSCPSTDSTAVVNSGATVIVPATSTMTLGGAGATQGSCANGWAACAASAGGGCCPFGYICGSSCTATVSGEQNTGKEAPSSASVTAWAWSFLVLGFTAAVGMILL